MISVQIAEGRDALEAIADEWDSWIDSSSHTATFSRPGWYLAWLDAFQPQRVAVVTARSEGRLVGLLPLMRMRTDSRGLYFHRVSPIAAGWIDYQAPLVDRSLASEALPAMLDAAFCHFGHRGTYWWQHVPADDDSLQIIRAHLSSRKMPFAEEHDSAHRLRLHSVQFEDAEKQWSKNHRTDVRRQRKRLAEQGPVSLWQPSSIEEADPVLQDLFQVHDAKWLAQGYPGMFQNPVICELYRSLLRRLWGAGLHFSTVKCGDTHVSFHFGFFSGGWVQWYKPTYRPEFSKFSPTKIHVALVIEDCCKNGWKGVDFLLGADAYKAEWANESLDVVSLHAGFHRFAPSYFWFSRGKPYLRQRFQHTLLRAKAVAQKLRGSTPAS
jgi:CelD/BcsL family acetyltransferase involved in cellulose biosynthesis